MIWYLRWTCQVVVGTELLIVPDGGGVGYLVSVTSSLLGTQSGDEVEVYIYHHITEQWQKLFGFSSLTQRELFLAMLTVNGLGPKGALSLLELGESTFLSAVWSWDEKILTQASGVGPKLAKKIILELSGKLDMSASDVPESQTKIVVDNADIIDALTAMGYERRAIEKVLMTVPEQMTTVEERTRYCVLQLAHS